MGYLDSLHDDITTERTRGRAYLAVQQTATHCHKLLTFSRSLLLLFDRPYNSTYCHAVVNLYIWTFRIYRIIIFFNSMSMSSCRYALDRRWNYLI